MAKEGFSALIKAKKRISIAEPGIFTDAIAPD